MSGAFLFGAAFGLGLSVTVAVFGLAAVVVMTVWREVSAWWRVRRVVREAITGLDCEEAEAMMRDLDSTEDEYG